MKLCITHEGAGSLACTVESGTLRYKQPAAYSVERVEELSTEIVSVLHRGNRAHKLTESNLEHLRVIGEELAQRLLPRNILAEIRRTMGSLTLELDEELLLFPWELLYDGEQFLCRRFDIGRIVRTSHPPHSVIQRSELSSPLRLLVVCADPEHNLPQVEKEGIEIISKLEGNTAVLARMVTVSNLKFVRRELKDYDLVHFAGHAEPRASESGFAWRLEDGLLTAKEISQMGAGRPMPSMVFSNACRSGTFHPAAGPSKNDSSFFGLAEGFLLAGVRHYIGTQWEMVDGQGAQFASHLYLDLSRGATMGAAVRNARNRVIAESGEGQLAWASYVMYGDPETVLLKGEKEEKMTEPPSLRLGVRATAPFKPREAGRGPVVIEPLEETGVAPGTRAEKGIKSSTQMISLTLSSLAAALSLLISGSLGYYLLFRKSPIQEPSTEAHQRAENKEADGPQSSKRMNSFEKHSKLNSGSEAKHQTGARNVVIHTHRLAVPGESHKVLDGLAVLEACLLDGLSRRTSLTVMHKPLDDTEDDHDNRATHILELQGHMVAKEVVMTVKLRDVKSDLVVSTSVHKADRRLLEDCRTAADRLVIDAQKKHGDDSALNDL